MNGFFLQEHEAHIRFIMPIPWQKRIFIQWILQGA